MTSNYISQPANQKLATNYLRTLDFHIDDYFKLHFLKIILNFSHMNFTINIKRGKKN